MSYTDSYKDQMNIRIPRELKDKAIRLCKENNTSISQLIRLTLTEYVKTNDKRD